MKVRKVVTVSAIAFAIASGPAVAGVAQADPNPPPSSPTTTPILTVDDAKAHVKRIEDRAREVIENARETQGPFWF